MSIEATHLTHLTYLTYFAHHLTSYTSIHPLVSAIVLNYRSPQDCVKCVQALVNQTLADRLEILVVDNHSDDESVGMLRARFAKKSSVRILEGHANRGFSAGNNLAASQAHGEYLLIINPDNVMPNDGLERLLSVLESDPQAGIVGPALVYPDGSIRPSARSFPSAFELLSKRLNPAAWYTAYCRKINAESTSVLRVDWLVGACLLMRRSLFQELCGFDERFFLFFEDMDLCRRAKQRGKVILYAPFIRVLDRRQRLSDGGVWALILKKTTRIHVASAIKYFWKWRMTRYC